MRFRDRVEACFQALATGDAIGKQTETLSRAGVLQWYPHGVLGFHGEPGSVIPRYAGRRYEWRVGETTDDTEQTIAVARALLRAGGARHESTGAELLRCRKSAHPGVRLWEFLQKADAAATATTGDGCGAAMRAAPAGVIAPSHDLEALVQAAYETSISTHGGQLAICAAAAVAAAVSAALDGHNATQVLEAALSASRLAEKFRPATDGLTMTACIQAVHSDLARLNRLSPDAIAERHFPDKPAAIVPLAISLAVITESAEDTALLASNIGGDTDSVASIGSAIAGALHPASVNAEWFRIVRSVNPGECEELLLLAGALAKKWPRGGR
jgi:ADP-ribosylglycohydrolase